ncbi:MAG: hypothetical protein JNJ57_08830 [Saprospiraceae bacterium]|nr:hypothetical protein [Saprospiraceae bacterium]
MFVTAGLDPALNDYAPSGLNFDDMVHRYFGRLYSGSNHCKNARQGNIFLFYCGITIGMVACKLRHESPAVEERRLLCFSTLLDKGAFLVALQKNNPEFWRIAKIRDESCL